jgi:uncharacterized protein YndB with AHSA1/START domain
MDRATSLEIQQWIDAPPHVVFDYLVDPSLIVRWMGVEARVDPSPQGAWEIAFDGGVRTWGEFTEIDPPRRLVFSWGCQAKDPALAPPGVGMTTDATSTVEITLIEQNQRTLLRLVHKGFHPLEPAEGGWIHLLAQLSRLFIKS